MYQHNPGDTAIRFLAPLSGRRREKEARRKLLPMPWREPQQLLLSSSGSRTDPMLMTVCSEMQHRPIIAATNKRIRTMESFLAMGSIEFPPISDPMRRSAVDLLAVCVAWPGITFRAAPAQIFRNQLEFLVELADKGAGVDRLRTNSCSATSLRR